MFSISEQQLAEINAALAEKGELREAAGLQPESMPADAPRFVAEVLAFRQLVESQVPQLPESLLSFAYSEVGRIQIALHSALSAAREAVAAEVREEE